MPGFIRSKKDEAYWKKAKKAVSRSKDKKQSSFTDRDWALVNHIYHQIKKSLSSASSIEDVIEVLKKARRQISDEALDPMEAYDVEDQDELGEGFRVFDPDEEQSSAGEDWLRENDPEYNRSKEYQEYSDDEDEDYHQRSIAEDLGYVDQDEGDYQEDAPTYEPRTSAVSQVRRSPRRAEQVPGEEPGAAPARGARPKEEVQVQEQKVPQQTSTEPIRRPSAIRPEDSPQEIQGKRGRFRHPTREELVALRSYTRPWEQRARDLLRLQADPSKNPVLAHQGSIIEARNKAYADKKAAYQKFITSDEYINADPITQMELDDKFEAEWRAKNPEYLMTALQSHHEAHQKGRGARDIFAAKKDERIRDIISGGSHAPEGMSIEEAMQHVGGVKGEHGTEGSIANDPAAAFAARNQDFIQQYAKDYHSKSKKPLSIGEMMDYNESSKRDISRILGPAPAKDPNFDKFFAHYYPLIGISAHKAIKALGLDPKHPDIDMSMLHEAGMHGLIQAINDYDHDNPSKASFATHAANKIRGLQMTALKSMDAIPAEIRQAHKKYVAQARMNRLLSDKRHPEHANINDRINKIKIYRAVSSGSGSINPPMTHASTSSMPSQQPSMSSQQQQQQQGIKPPTTGSSGMQSTVASPSGPRIIRRPAKPVGEGGGTGNANK